MVAKKRAPGRRLAVFIDGSNISRTLRLTYRDTQIDWSKLLEYFATLGTVVGVFIYFSGATPRGADDETQQQRMKQWQRFLRKLQQSGYRLFVKEPSPVYSHETVGGDPVAYKTDCDVEIAVDMVALATTGRIDEIILMSGDRDFVYPVQRIRDFPYAIRVTVVSFHSSISQILRDACDEFILFDSILPSVKTTPTQVTPSESDPNNR